MSSTLHALLHELSDGRFHSGDALGQKLGISRSAVWKNIRKIGSLGLDVHSVKGKGYRLSRPLELLDPAAIRAVLLATAGDDVADIEILLSVHSTNSYVMESLQRDRLNLAPGRSFVCAAERQTAGKGRRGRRWISPFGHNVYLTLARTFNSGAAELEGLSLVVGLAILRVLRRSGASGLVLKWPNDLYWQDRKLAGILLEMTGDLAGECQLLIGMGLNVRMEGETTAGIAQPWVDLATIVSPLPGRNRLVAELVAELSAMLAEFERGGFAGFRDEWLRADMLLDKPVELKKNIEHDNMPGIRGISRGVDDKGAIMLETDSGLRAFHAGELSARVVPEP